MGLCYLAAALSKPRGLSPSGNASPINTVPGAQSVYAYATLTFSGTIAVADTEGGTLTVRFRSVGGNGRLTLSGVTGLSFTNGDGTDDADMTFSGTISAINTALNGATYVNQTYAGEADTIRLTTTDAGSLVDTDDIAVTVKAVEIQDITFSGSTTGAADGDNGDLFTISGEVDGTPFTTANIAYNSTAATLAANIQTALRAIAEIGASGVTCTGSNSGNDRVIRCRFSGTLADTVTELTVDVDDVYKASVVNQDVQTQGTDEVTATQASVTVTASGNDDTTTDTIGNSVTLDGGGAYASSAAASGWTAGSPSGESVTFTKDDPGFFDLDDYAVASGNGSVNADDEGTDAVPAASEVQRFWFDPAPIRGQCKVKDDAIGNEDYNISSGQVETAINSVYGITLVSVSGSGTSGDKFIATLPAELGNVDDGYLTVTDVNLAYAYVTAAVAVIQEGAA